MDVQNKQTIIIDLRQNSMVQLPHFTQYDTNILEFNIKQNGVNADLANVTKIVANYKRKDGKVITRMLTNTGNMVTYTLGAEEMEAAGIAEVSLSFFNGETRLSTAKLKLYMNSSLGPYFEKGEGLPLLQELFVEVAELITSTNEAGNYALEKAAEADQAAQGALSAKNGAETATQAANTAAESANAAAGVASEAKTIANNADTKATTALSNSTAADTKANETQRQLDTIIIESGTSDAETIQARGPYNVLNTRLNNIDQELAETQTELMNTSTDVKNAKQTHLETYKTIGTKNSDYVIVKKDNANRYAAYVHHHNDVFQEWRLTNEAYPFDPAVSVHASGDAYLNDIVYNTRINKSKDVQDTDSSLVKSGTWPTSGNNIYSLTTGDYVELTFYGSSIRLSYSVAANAGMAKITIDGRTDLVNQITPTGSDALLDMYAASGSTVSTWLAIGLPVKWHTVRIAVSGQKNVNSTDYRVYVDYFRYEFPPFTLDNTLTGLTFTRTTMPDGKNVLREGSSAIELAISNTLNGNAVWSGSVHRNAYPRSAPVFYIDGFPINMAIGEIQYGKEFVVYQEVTLINGSTNIANLDITYKYTCDGLLVSWNLTWLVDIHINNSYSAMFGTYANRIKFGGSAATLTMLKDEVSNKGNVETDHIIGWHTTNNYVVMLNLLDYQADTMNYDNYDSGMFVWDRAKDAKMYAPKYKGAITAGTVWNSIFRVSMKHCYNVTKLLT